MAITAAFTNQAKQDFLNGVHQPGDTYMIALYVSSATINKSTTAYTASGEVATGGNYSAGGTALSGFTVGLSSDTAYLTFSNPSWASATITARGALIYNSSRSNKAIAVLDFGSDITSTAGTFLVSLPAAGASSTITIT